MELEFYIAQIISIFTTIVAIVFLQCKSMKWILLGQLTANLLSSLTYFLLGGFSGAGICLLAIVQSIVMFIFSQKKKSPPIWIILVFIVLYVACSVLYYKSVIDIFSALAAVLFCVSIAQEDAKKSRLWYVFNPICWLIYSVFCRAYLNCITYSFVLISTLVAMVRVDGIFRRKKEK